MTAGTASQKAIETLETASGGIMKPNLFRGAETLIKPDVHQLLTWNMSIRLLIVQPALSMQASGAKPKDIPTMIAHLKKERLLNWHLMNPTNEKVHPSRSMPCQLIMD
jgi:hypothetical protein